MVMAKKRYYQGKKDRKDESMGMKGAMIGRDMPSEVIMRDYPSMDYLEQSYEDTIVGIDSVHDGAVRGARKQRMNKKY